MIGQTISHYKIIDKLGEGGMGIVYKARDTRLDRTVALKFLPKHLTSSVKDKQRFIREAKAAAALNHPNICTIHNVDEHNGIPFIVMEIVEGKNLREVLKTERVGHQAIIEYAIQIASALQEAHSRGIIHRDIKCDNLMVTPGGRIKVMDFGLAKLKGSVQVTKSGNTVGTISYMSPEQVRGEEVDERSDIWSVGIVLYELLTGKLPFKADYDHAVMYSILNSDPKPVSGLIDSIPPELEEIVNRCIAKDPTGRFQSAADLLKELQAVREIVSSDIKKSAGHHKGHSIQGKIYRRRYILAGSTAVAVILLLLVMFVPDREILQNEFSDYPVNESILLMVLPFTNIGEDPDRQMFCDGLVETITSNLTQISRTNRDLWIVPAQVQEDVSILPAADGERQYIKSPAEAYRTFGVNYVIRGSLQPIADSLRLTLHLVDAKNNRLVDSSLIDVQNADVFTLQNKSVESVLTMLDLELSPETEEVIKKGYASDPAAFELYMQGIGNLKRYERIENINAAIELLGQSVEADPQFALAYAGLGQAYWRKYEYTGESEWLEKADEHALKAYDLNNELTQVNITLGIINRGTGEYELAIENFNNVLAVDPTNADAYRELARVYESLGDISEAEATHKRAIRLKPDDWAGYGALGTFYFRHNRYDDAIEQFKKVIEITPDNHHGYSNLGAMFYYQGQNEEARGMFEKSLELSETFEVTSNLGTLYYIQGKYREAAQMYERALDIHDGHYRVWGNLGAAYYYTPDEREKAYPAYEHAIELAEDYKRNNPSDYEVFIDLAGYSERLGKEEDAKAYMEQALELSSGNTVIMFSAGTILERLGEREEALYWIMKAIENGHSKSEIVNQPELQDLIKDERFPEISENIRSESE